MNKLTIIYVIQLTRIKLIIMVVKEMVALAMVALAMVALAMVALAMVVLTIVIVIASQVINIKVTLKQTLTLTKLKIINIYLQT